MIIKSLVIKQFKGIDEMICEFSNTVIIKGDIDKNKTSILDAIHFLFVGKNIEDEKQFPLLPIYTEPGPKQGKIIPGTEPSVEGHIVLDDGVGHILKRQIHKKTRDTEVYIDGYKKTVGEFNDFISENIIDYESFRLFFNPKYFTGLEPKKARDVFRSKFGDVDVETVIEETKHDFSGTFIEELKVAQAPEVLEKYKDKASGIEREKQLLDGKIEALEEQIKASGFTENENMLSLKKRKTEIETEIGTFNSAATAYNEYLGRKQNVLNEILHYKSKIESLTSNLSDKTMGIIARLDDDRLRLVSKLGNLRSEYKTLTVTKPNGHTCPTCNAPLVGDMLAKAKENLKLQILDNIDQGKKLNKEVASIDKELNTLKTDKPVDDMKIKTLQSNVLDLRTRLQDMEAAAPQHPGDVTELNQEYQEIAKKIGSFDDIKRMQDTIGQYINEQKEYSVNLEKAIIVKNDSESFIHAQAQFLVSKVNSQFKRIKIELFKKLKNGDLKPTFLITLNGVPYHGLNNGGKMIAGLEIQQYFKQFTTNSIPVLIDRYESYEAIDISEYLGNSQSIVTIVEKDAPLQIINK